MDRIEADCDLSAYHKALLETRLREAQRAADPPLVLSGGLTYHDVPKPHISLHESTIGEEEIQAVIEVLRSGQVTSGAKVREFEAAFPGEYAVMCNSGSSANLLAIAALCDPATPNRLERGDGVIVSALSWSTTVWPLVQYGLVPVIVDIDPLTLNMDPLEVDEAINAGVRAIMPVHVYGNPCDMWLLRRIAWDHSAPPREIIIIEDCCEALGAEFDGMPIGSFSDVATYSFYFSHHITTVEGGMCVTMAPGLSDRMRILRSHGWTRDVVDDQVYRDANPDIDPRFLFVGAGYNLRSTEMAAAMGLVQLPKLVGFVDARRTAAKLLIEAFEPYENWLTWQHETPNGRSSWFGFPIVIKDDAPFTAKQMREVFDMAGIETRPIICGNIALQPGMKYYPHKIIGDLPNATRAMKNGLAISCHQGVDAADCDYVRSVLDDFMRSY